MTGIPLPELPPSFVISEEYADHDPVADDLERELLGALAQLQQSYQRAAEPIVLQLTELRARRRKRYILVPT